VLGHFQPTFLYEVIWDVLVCLVLLWADRRFSLGHGRLFALYVIGYTLGRGWIEHLRSDYAHAFLGLRVNDWASILCFTGALAYLLISRRLRPGRETPAELYWPHFKPYHPASGGQAGPAAPGDADEAEDGSGSAPEPERGEGPDPETGADGEADSRAQAKHEEHA
jgi:hypothetical protein